MQIKLKEGLEEGKFSEFELIDLLDAIEEFGNQHIYLYNCNSQYLNLLKNSEYIKEGLKDNGLEKLYNNKYRIFMPNEPELSSVTHNDRELKFKWVEKRTWNSSIESKIEDDKLYEIYRINKSRGVTTFRVDLITGATELMVQRLPTGTNYEEIKEEYLQKLSNFMDIYPFQHMKLRRALRLIERSDEVEKRQMNFETISGEKVAFRSRDRRSDYTSVASTI